MRAAVGGPLLAQGVVSLGLVGPATLRARLLGGLACVCGALVLAGLRTRAAGFLSGVTLLGVVLLGAPAERSVLDEQLAVVLLFSTSAVVALLGPGAHSIDARIFGLREIDIPRASPRSEPALTPWEAPCDGPRERRGG